MVNVKFIELDTLNTCSQHSSFCCPDCLPALVIASLTFWFVASLWLLLSTNRVRNSNVLTSYAILSLKLWYKILLAYMKRSSIFSPVIAEVSNE